MRSLIQRVSEASVTIDGEIRGAIKQGLLILLGIEAIDGPEDIEWLVKKISQMRIFNDPEGKMNLNIQDVGGRALVISQFTLHASTKKGNRPSYIRAAKPDFAIPLYDQFLSALAATLGHPVEAGEFGANMKVSLINDGPVTIWLDSKAKE